MPPLISSHLIHLLLFHCKEFVFNKGQRIFFEQSSANGILLFRETSAILCAYGSRILQVPVNQDIYLEKYKGIYFSILSILSITKYWQVL